MAEMAHSLQLAQLLDSEREASSMTDITLVCGGKSFPAHKIILSATSSYFRTLFSADGEESASTKIELPSVSAEEMEVILPFMYTGKFKDIDDRPLLEALLATSYYLHVNALFECCYKKLSETLSCSNFLDMSNLAFEYNDEGMITHVITFLGQNFEEVALFEEFVKLNACQIQTLCHHHDALKYSMDIVISGLFRWAEVEEAREITLLQILSTLDLQRLSTAFLSEKLCQQTLVRKEFHILTLLTAVATSRVLTLSTNQIANINKPKLLALGKNDCRQEFITYNIKQNEWSLSQNLPFHLENDMSMVYFDNHVYIVGGGQGSLARTTAKVIKYCPVTNTIVSFGTLAVPVGQAGTAVIDDHIYVVNGVNANFEGVCTVQRYDPVTNVCQMAAPTNKPHNQPHVLPFGKHLLVTGQNHDENTIERYDPVSDTWTVVTSFHIAQCTIGVCQNKLFVVSTQGISEFQIYDFTSNKWEQKQFAGSPETICGVYPALIEGNHILLVFDKKGILYSLDPNTSQWITKTAANTVSWEALKACVV